MWGRGKEGKGGRGPRTRAGGSEPRTGLTPRIAKGAERVATTSSSLTGSIWILLSRGVGQYLSILTLTFPRHEKAGLTSEDALERATDTPFALEVPPFDPVSPEPFECCLRAFLSLVLQQPLHGSAHEPEAVVGGLEGREQRRVFESGGQGGRECRQSRLVRWRSRVSRGAGELDRLSE